MDKHLELLIGLLIYRWDMGADKNNDIRWETLGNKQQQIALNYYIYDYLKYGTSFKAVNRFV